MQSASTIGGSRGNRAMTPLKGSKTVIWRPPNAEKFQHHVYGVAWKE